MRLAVKFTSNLPTTLKEEVEQTFGRPIFTAKDCIQLSAEIFNRTKVQISPNTLRRLFGLVKATNSPSKATLNVLAQYCGFYSLSDVPLSVQRNGNTEMVQRENVVNFLYGLFQEVPIEEMEKDILLELVKNILLLLNRDLELAHVFQRQIAKTPNGQTLYFEQFIHLDKLNDYYGDGLRYYMYEKKTAEAECFGYAMLTFRYWLSGDDAKLRQSFGQLQAVYPVYIKDPFIVGRYYAASLFYAHIQGEAPGALLGEAHKYHLGASQHKGRKQEFPFFEYVLSAALVLTGHSGEAQYYMDYSLEKFDRDPWFARLGNYQILHLLKGIAHSDAGEKGQAGRIFDKTNLSEFSFLSKKFSTILYLWLAGKLKRRIHRKEELLDALILETGFKRFLGI